MNVYRCACQVCVTWLWQAGGAASRDAKPVQTPEDVKGKKVRGGSREMDMMFKAAGASTLSLPSNEIYAAMQTGACDAATTSSTSPEANIKSVRRCSRSSRTSVSQSNPTIRVSQRGAPICGADAADRKSTR